ncbi:MAG: hypothetical protein AB8B56_03760 [Crocinitomicaceae bacterium]
MREQYIKDLYKHFNYYPTWLPGVPLELGDIGIIKNDEFTRISSLKNEEIAFEVVEDTTKTPLEFASTGGVTVTTKLAGSAKLPGSNLEEIDAGFSVEFKKERATLFKLKGTVSPSISDTISLGKEILARYKKGEWEKDWVIITEVVKAESSTIIVSSSNDSKLELKSKAKVGTDALKLTDASANFSIAYDKDVSLKFIATGGLTPLFRVMGIKGFFKAGFGTKGGSGRGDFFSPIKMESNSGGESAPKFVEIKPNVED